jgi:hypothetical protein
MFILTNEHQKIDIRIVEVNKRFQQVQHEFYYTGMKIWINKGQEIKN